MRSYREFVSARDKPSANVEQEVMVAYTDCWMDNFEEAEKKRKLDFKASQPVDVATAVRIMTKAIPGGYNEFNAELISRLGEIIDVEGIWLARESSVCIYVDCDEPNAEEIEMIVEELRADEVDYYADQLRIWWD